MIKALKHVLGEKIEKPANARELFELLSPYELETLLFLILKSRGIYVPAWRRGGLKDVDIVGYNLSNEPVILPPVKFEPNLDGNPKPVMFQVKRKLETLPKELPENFWIVSINFKKRNKRILDPEWLIEQIMGQEDVIEWLGNTLRRAVDDIKALINNCPENRVGEPTPGVISNYLGGRGSATN